MPLVHAEADYARPMLLGDVLTIELEVERLGEKSVTFAYRIVGADGAPARRSSSSTPSSSGTASVPAASRTPSGTACANWA